MGMQPLSGFIGGAYTLPSKNVACQRCVNMFLEKVGTEDETQAYLLGTPGISGLTSFPYASYGYRQNGVFTTSNGLLIVALVNKLYAFTRIADNDLVPWLASSDGQFGTLDGSSELSVGPIAMADNGIILFVSSYNAVYQYSLSELAAGSTITGGRIQTWPYGGFTHIGYMNSKLIINTPYDTSDDPTQNKFRVSPLDWGGVAGDWDPLAFASADQSPDPLLALIVRGGDLLLFNSGTFEVWYDAGADTQPFNRNISIVNEIGIGAKYSLAKSEDSVFWLGAGNNGFRKIFALDGYQAKRISTHAIEYELSSYADTDQAVGLTYQKNGHTFYIISFPTADKSWQYDLSTGEWNELSSTNTEGNQERCRYVATTAFAGETVAMDRIANGPVLVDSESYTEAGQLIFRLRSTPHTYSKLNRIFFNRLQLNMETGVGITSGQGSDPKIRLRWSNDSGHTWSDYLLRSLGKIGEYTKRVIWNRLGQARHRVWEISTSEPVPIRILGLFFDAQEGDN